MTLATYWKSIPRAKQGVAYYLGKVKVDDIGDVLEVYPAGHPALLVLHPLARLLVLVHLPFLSKKYVQKKIEIV